MKNQHLRTEDLRGLRYRGYIRESSEAQADKWSPERQREDLRRAAEELGLVPAEPVWYERTGTGETRSEELDRALADVGQYDVLLVLTTSRFARNRAEAVRRKGDFAKAGIPIYFVQDRIVSGARSSRLLEGVREVIDEEENEQRRFWIAGGQRQRQLSGRWVGRLPYGLRYVLVDFPDGTRRPDGKLEPDPETAPNVRRIFDLAAAGVSPRNIAIDLNLRAVRTVEGDPWSSRSVIYMLTNPVYVGRVIRYRRPATRHYYPETDPTDGRREVGRPFAPLIDDALFAQVGQAITERRFGGGGPKRRSYPLSRVLRCGKCGFRMTGVFSARHRYYRCSGRTNRGICEAPLTRADAIEGAFADWLAGYRLPADWRGEIARTSVTTIKTNEADRQTKLEERLARLKKQHEWGYIDDEAFRAKATEVRSEMGIMAKPAVASLEAVASAIGRLGRAWQSGPAEAKAALPPLILNAAEWADGRATWIVKAELRPLLELCVPESQRLYSKVADYQVRYSA